MALSSNGLNKIVSITAAPLPTLGAGAHLSDDQYTSDHRGLEDEKDVKDKDQDSDGQVHSGLDGFLGLGETAGLELDDPDKIIRTGADAAQYMLSDRDDGDPAVTVRSLVLGTVFAAFYASISQIYQVSLGARIGQLL